MALRQSVRMMTLLRRAASGVSLAQKLTQGVAKATNSNALFRHTAAGFHTTNSRFNANIINIQDEDDFTARVKESSTPVIVDFHAGWCGPCKLLGPRLESMVSSRDGKVILAKIDIDELGDLAIQHGVQAVPTVLAMKGGKVTDQFVGVKDDDQLESFINKLTGE